MSTFVIFFNAQILTYKYAKYNLQQKKAEVQRIPVDIYTGKGAHIYMQVRYSGRQLYQYNEDDFFI